MQNATSEDRCLRGTAYNDDRISQKKKKLKKKFIFFFYFKKRGGGSPIRACSLIRSNTVLINGVRCYKIKCKEQIIEENNYTYRLL